MTESDAVAIGAADKEELQRRWQEVASPREVERLVFNFLLHRIRGMSVGLARAVQESASSISAQGLGFSPSIAARARAVVATCQDHAEPEDARAIYLWMVGDSEQGPGVFQSMLVSFPDQDTDASLRAIEQDVVRARAIIRRRDAQLFAAVRQLSESRQRAVFGSVTRAAWAHGQGDGETAKSQLIRGRVVARRLLRAERHRKTYWD